MATAPITITTNLPYAPKRVSQGDDRHADLLAVIATLCGKSISEVRTQAEALGVPKTGPYSQHLADGDLLAKLLAHFGWVATVWKDADKGFTGINGDLAIVGVDADLDYEVSRYVLFHRTRSADGKTAQHYVVDTYPHPDSKLHVRTDLTGLTASWYLGLHPQNKPAGK